MVTILFSIGVAAAALIAAFKYGYSQGKKNLLIHLSFKKMITGEQFQELTDEDI